MVDNSVIIICLFVIIWIIIFYMNNFVSYRRSSEIFFRTCFGLFVLKFDDFVKIPKNTNILKSTWSGDQCFRFLFFEPVYLLYEDLFLWLNKITTGYYLKIAFNTQFKEFNGRYFCLNARYLSGMRHLFQIQNF